VHFVIMFMMVSIYCLVLRFPACGSVVYGQFLLKPLNYLVARHFGQQEVLSLFITVNKPDYITFINLAVAFDAPTHQDIRLIINFQ